ncbi:hypothetical protein BV20DRAFT_1123883 [Pilatotrama ljubarskyi]|nr:hypothetical protein BV20DRAFT_1123883 [Pilatotrama ljubarskyi]
MSSRPMRSSKQTALNERLWTRDLPTSHQRAESDASAEDRSSSSKAAKKKRSSKGDVASCPSPASTGKFKAKEKLERVPPRLRLKAPKWVEESSEDEGGGGEDEDTVSKSSKKGKAPALLKRKTRPQAEQSAGDVDSEGDEVGRDVAGGSEDGSDGGSDEDKDKGEDEDDAEQSGGDNDWANLPDEAKNAEIPTWTALSENEEDIAQQPFRKSGKRAKHPYQISSSPRSSPIPLGKKRARTHFEDLDTGVSDVEDSRIVKKAKSKATGQEKQVSKGIEKRRLAQRDLEEPKFKAEEPNDEEARSKSKRRRTALKRHHGSTGTDAQITIKDDSSDDVADTRTGSLSNTDIELVYPDSKWTKLPLGPQVPRVRKVAHLAIYNVSVRILFVDAFPDGSTAQSLYASKALMESADKLQFADIKKRLETDEDYCHDLATIPGQRISVLRGPIKKLATPLMTTVYGLSSDGCQGDAQWLLTGLRYIYPYHAGTKPDTPIQKRWVIQNMPYKNDAILEVLHDGFFSGHPSHAERYKLEFSSDRSECSQVFSGSHVLGWIIRVIPQVGSTIRDWMQANRRPKRMSNFSADANSEIYASHIKVLTVIKEDSLAKYHVLMHGLYVMLTSGGKLAKAPDTKVEDALAILDLSGMPASA